MIAVVFMIFVIILLFSIGIYLQYEFIASFFAESEPEVPKPEQLKPKNTVRKLHDKKEVFHIANNELNYGDAKDVCKQYGAELADYDQMVHHYQHGGDFCNYGWSKNQLALYPTQKKTWEQLQNADPEYRDICGHYGVNGGKFSKEMRFGANCYGKKPEKPDYDFQFPELPKKTEPVKRVRRFKNVVIAPFNRNRWKREAGNPDFQPHHTF